MAGQSENAGHSTIADSLDRMRESVVDRPNSKRVMRYSNEIVDNDSLPPNNGDAKCNIGEYLMKSCRIRHSGGEPGLFEDFEGGVLGDVHCGNCERLST